MKKWLIARRRYVWAALFALVAATAWMLAITFSRSYHRCEGESAKEYRHAYQPSTDERLGTLLFCQGESLDANGELLTAIGTLIIAIFTATLWRVTDRSVSLARDEFNAAHLPCIEIQRIYREDFDIGKRPTIKFLVSNEGETNARIEIIKLAIEIEPRLPAVRKPERWDEEYSDIDVPARSGYPLSATRLKSFSEAEYDAAVENWSRSIYFLAQIEYSDARGRRRGKSFCYLFNPREDRFLLQTDPNYTYGS